MSGAESIPMTAWEQAAIVVLFGLVLLTIIGWLLSWMSKQMANLQTFQSEMIKQFQAWMADRDRAFSERNRDVCESIQAVTAQLRALTRQMTEHDERAKPAIDIIVNGDRKAVQEPKSKRRVLHDVEK